MSPINAFVITTAGEPGETRLRHFMNQWRFTPSITVVSNERDHENPSRGCWEAHRKAMFLSNDKPCVIFEDDAEFAGGFTLDVQYPKDWDMFYFGGQHTQRPTMYEYSVNTYPGAIVKCARMHATHAYAVRYPRRVALMLGPGDSARPNGDVSHALQHVVRDARFNVYAVRPLTVGQSVSTSVIDGFHRQEAEFWNDYRAEPRMKGEQ